MKGKRSWRDLKKKVEVKVQNQKQGFPKDCASVQAKSFESFQTIQMTAECRRHAAPFLKRTFSTIEEREESCLALLSLLYGVFNTLSRRLEARILIGEQQEENSRRSGLLQDFLKFCSKESNQNN